STTSTLVFGFSTATTFVRSFLPMGCSFRLLALDVLTLDDACYDGPTAVLSGPYGERPPNDPGTVSHRVQTHSLSSARARRSVGPHFGHPDPVVPHDQ